MIHSEARYFLPGAKLMETKQNKTFFSVFYIILVILCIYVELLSYVVLHNSTILLSTIRLVINGLPMFLEEPDFLQINLSDLRSRRSIAQNCAVGRHLSGYLDHCFSLIMLSYMYFLKYFIHAILFDIQYHPIKKAGQCVILPTLLMRHCQIRL